MFKILIILTIIAITGCSTTNQDIDFNWHKKTFKCTDENGNDIKILPANIATSPIKLAYASYNSRTRERSITLSLNLIISLPPEALEFTAYHECGHHKLKHFSEDTKNPSTDWLKRSKKRQHEADCFASETYINKHGYIGFIKLIQIIRKERFLSDKRITKILQCN